MPLRPDSRRPSIPQGTAIRGWLSAGLAFNGLHASSQRCHRRGSSMNLAGDIRAGSFHQRALFEFHDPIGDVENFVVMGHHHDRGFVVTGQGSEQIHHIAS